ncbi:type II toxin-antitoxin system Phd/YefM family antitoxin [Phenylobacterium aquaticum]|uniref:type II toxin-antitoxin system Phd/YefM family antitoxin n=1 Tax=Phenylobacterium aquaticum TaxID=1763816 RepID=UPI0026EADF95|nr:hypothetical protein [Phenylobacterium aquaticum]
MSTFSVEDAQANLEKLLDLVLQGEPVTLERDGVAVVELRAVKAPPKPGAWGSTEWLSARRSTRPGIGISSVELIAEMYDEGAPVAPQSSCSSEGS